MKRAREAETGAAAASTLLILLVMTLGLPLADAAAQQPERGWGLSVTASVGGGIRQGASRLGVGTDLRSYGARLTVARPQGIEPWVQVDRFWRPDLDCQAISPCNDEGWAARAGITLTLSEDDTRPGVHPALAGGIGYAFSDTDELSHLVGVGFLWSVHPAVAPRFDVRYERLPGLSGVAILALGLRLRIF